MFILIIQIINVLLLAAMSLLFSIAGIEQISLFFIFFTIVALSILVLDQHNKFKAF